MPILTKIGQTVYYKGHTDGDINIAFYMLGCSCHFVNISTGTIRGKILAT